MGLNIKNPETHRLIQELAAPTGKSMITVITEAVRERLHRLRSAYGVGLAERLVKISQDCAAHLKEPFESADHGKLLYDERGLPR